MNADRGLFGPETVFWKVNRENVVLLAGAAAATLQVAHPSVARGVANHSRFREDAAGRLKRTLDAVYTVGFGRRQEVERVRRQVGAMHARVQGTGYSAADPQAQLWVTATLVQGSVTMFERFVSPLDPAEKSGLLQDYARFAEVFGLPPGLLPQDWTEFERYWEGMIHGDLLGSDPLCGEVARAVLSPRRPIHFKLLAPAISILGTGLIPHPLCRRLGLKRGRATDYAWRILDFALPSLVRVAPKSLRFCAHYRRAVKSPTRASSSD